MSIKEFVENAIAAETVVIFSKSYCPYSQMAKEVFDKLNHTYKVVELDGREDHSDEIQDVLAEMTGARSIPRVFIKGECIGGGTDCEAMFKSGELPRKLHHIMFNIPFISPDKRIIQIKTKDYVEKIIARNTVAIFSKSYCPYCKMAKEIFDQLNQPYKAIELDERKDGYEIQDYLGEMTGVKSVPRVFIKGACIGGGSDCKTLLDNGELQKKL